MDSKPMDDASRTPPATMTELHGMRRWLIWRLAIDADGRSRKLPCYAGNGRARGEHGTEADRAQMVTFDEARAAAKAHGFTGVGFAPMPGDNVTALDFDACVADGVVDPAVEALVAGTYAELSPSRNGVRAFVRGDLGDRKSKGLELFASRGFVTVTGQVLDSCLLLGNEDTIAEPSASLLQFIVERFGDRPVRASDGGPSNTQPLGLALDALRDMLATLSAGLPYDEWVQVGMRIHHETGGSEEGFTLWDEWSSRSEKYPGERELRMHWRSFGKRESGKPLTVNSLPKVIREHGGDAAAAERSLALAGLEATPVGPAAPPELPAFARDQRGRIEASIANVVRAVAHPATLGCLLRRDTFLDSIMVAPADAPEQWRAIRDEDYTDHRVTLEKRRGFKRIALDDIRKAVARVALDHPLDTATVWLESLAWDAVPRLERFAPDYLGAADTPYARAVGLYLWTALAGRVLEPGCKADMVVVLVGAQGSGKSTSIAAISPSPDFVLELDLSKQDDDAARLMRGKLVIELGELTGLRRREAEALKAFISRTVDRWIEKYATHETAYRRRSVFIGSTNRAEFLDDATGARRWLPLDVGQCDAAAVARDRCQLWAEARERWLADGIAWADAERLARAEHVRFERVDPWSERLAEWLSTADIDGTVAGDGFVTHGMAMRVLELRDGQVDHRARDRITAVLIGLGFEPARRYVDGRQVRGFVRASNKTNETP